MTTESNRKIKESFDKINIDNKLLLLVCCAPCSCLLLQELKENDIDVTVLFYNPNIMPFLEYQMRKETVTNYCQKYGIKYEDLDDIIDYKTENQKWLNNVAKDLENLPEMSERCQKCFSFRLDQLFNFASKNNFKIVSSTLAVSIYKNFDQVRNAARLLEKKYSDVKYWYYDWQANDNYKLRRQIICSDKLYNQKYCGCVFSEKNRSNRNQKL